jgi:hypothetical protein
VRSRLLGLGVVLLALPTAARATSVPANLGCGGGRVVLALTYHVRNDVDTGVAGNNWAFDNYVRTLRVVRKRGNAYCAASRYSGTFTSLAGTSPAGTATIPAGIHGTFRGSSLTAFRATAATAGKRTRGDLGVKDFQCTSADVKGRCPGTWDWLRAYFTSRNGFATFRYVRYSFIYHATQGGKGTYSDWLRGGTVRTHGDIRVRAKPKSKHK